MDTVKQLNDTLEDIEIQLRNMLLNAFVGYFGEEAREKIEKTLKNVVFEIRPNGNDLSNSSYSNVLQTLIKNRELEIYKEFVPIENQKNLHELEFVNIEHNLKFMLINGISLDKIESQEKLLKLLGIDTEKIWGENTSDLEQEKEITHAQDLIKSIYKQIRNDNQHKLYYDLNNGLKKLRQSTAVEQENNRVNKQKIKIDEEYFEKIIDLVKEYCKIDISEKFDLNGKDVDKKVEFIHKVFYSDYQLHPFLLESNSHSAFSRLPNDKKEEFSDKFYDICFQQQSKIVEMKASNSNYLYCSRIWKKINSSAISESDKKELLNYTLNHINGISGFNASSFTKDGRGFFNFISLLDLKAETAIHEFFHAFGNCNSNGKFLSGFYYEGEKNSLNEAITEFMARKINRSYSGQTGVFVQNSQNEENEDAGYGAMIVLIEDLLESWTPKIKEYMLSDSPDKLEIFKDEVGREDFDMLQDKLSEFYSLYKSSTNSKFIQLIADEKNISNSIEYKDKFILNSNDSKLYDLSIEIKQLASIMLKENVTEEENDII